MGKLIKWGLIIFGIFFVFWLFTDDSEIVESDYTDEIIKDTIEVSNTYKEAKNTTVLIYMIGSDLESESEEATTDISEMLKAGVGENTNVIIQTMGTKKWANYNISAKRTERYRVEGKSLRLVDDSLPQLDSTKSKTLSDFISWGVNNYKADRYQLILWNHGGGPVYGFGLDQNQSEDEALTIDEIQSALKKANVHFDFIGMDSCIMSSLEVAAVLQPYCDYAILSEDFESGYGWQYTRWLKQIEHSPYIDTVQLGKILVDDMIKSNVDNDEDSATLAVIDESKIGKLYSVWKKFAYENEKKLLNENYSREKKQRGRGFLDSWLYDDSDVTMDSYYITDIMSVASTISSDTSDALKSALNEAIAYYKYTSEDDLTGISICLPYGDKDFYKQLKEVYTNSGFDKDYVNWLNKFVTAKGKDNYYDYSEFDDEWLGWGKYEDDYDWDDWGDYDYEDEDWYDEYEYGFFDAVLDFIFG